MIQPQEPEFTEQMMKAVLWQMLRDCGGVTIRSKFFENVPEDAQFEAQYDATNEEWHLFVKRERKRTILLPNKEIIHG